MSSLPRIPIQPVSAVRTRKRAVASAVLFAPWLLCSADQLPVNPEAAAQAKYTCQAFADKAAKAQAAMALSVKTSDKNALACTADLRFEVASGSHDRGAYLAALSAVLRYIDHVIRSSISISATRIGRSTFCVCSMRQRSAQSFKRTCAPTGLTIPSLRS